MLNMNKVARGARAWSAVVANVAKAVYYLVGLVGKWGG